MAVDINSVLGIFGRYGVDPGINASGETAMQRLERIANELRGGRTIQNLEGSLQLQSNALSPEQRRANQTAAYEFNPQWGQLNRNLESLGRNRSRDTDAINRFAEGGRAALGNVYQNLQNQLTQNNQAVSGAFQSALGNVGQTYDQGAQVIQAARDAALADTNREAQALGVAGSVVDPNADLRNAVSSLLGQQQTGRDNATSALNTLMTSQNAINSRAVTDAASEGALMQDRHQVAQANALAQLLSDYGQQEFDVMGQLGDLEASRGARTSELLNQFQDQTYDRTRESALDQLAAEIQRGTLALQQRELGMSAQQFQQQFGLDAAQFAAQLPGIQLENQLLGQQLGQQTFQPGQAGVDAYLAQFGGGPQITGPQGTSVGGNGGQQRLQQLFSQMRMGALTQAAQVGANPFDVFELLVSQTEQGDPSTAALIPHLRRMAEIYWGVA